jgi:thiamine-monophosphate kinase
MPLAEQAIIARIRRRAAAGRSIVNGIGDDCSVLRLPAAHEALVTTDFSLEGVHFRRDWHPAHSVGHRCLARGLSDIAAMGGLPHAAFLSLALPPALPQRWVDDFLRGLLALARRSHVTLAGGDTAESPGGVLADIVVVGSIPRGHAILRSGACPGDLIYVSGALGASAATLQRMRQAPRRKLNPRNFPRHFFPEPRLELGRILREKQLASAMIDLSDGLSTDLAHICKESGVGAELHAHAIPLASFGKRAVSLDLALHGGEDYELLFTVPARARIPRRIAGVPITEIGRITARPGMRLLRENGSARPLSPRGWEHFRA